MNVFEWLAINLCKRSAIGIESCKKCIPYVKIEIQMVVILIRRDICINLLRILNKCFRSQRVRFFGRKKNNKLQLNQWLWNFMIDHLVLVICTAYRNVQVSICYSKLLALILLIDLIFTTLDWFHIFIAKILLRCYFRFDYLKFPLIV